MKKLNLNEEQKRAVECDDDLILCMAGAGSGKTTVLIERISRLCEKEDPKSILALTFTNAAAFEMKDRYIRRNPGKLVPEFRTFHSFCYSVLCTDYEIQNKLGYHSVPSICDEAKMKRIQNTVYLELGLHLSKDELSRKVKLSPKKEQEFALYKKRIKKVMKDENIITFDELSSSICDLFFNEDRLTQKYKDRFKYLLIDEFQDTSPEQWKFATSFKHSKIFLVGDEMQCQPAGSIVTMADMTKKKIEDIQIGDYVLSYNRREGRYLRCLNYNSGNLNRYTSKVTDISKHFATDVVKLVTRNHESRYTKSHLTYARIHFPGNENAFVTYLMSNKKGWWRVGSTKLFLTSQNDYFGPRLRLQEEKGNKIWILGVYSSQNEAWMNEQLVAYKYGIPQVTWQHKNVKFSLDDVDYLYSNLGDLSEKANICLKAYSRDINYPFFTDKDKNNHFSKLHLFECRVGNVIPGIFDIVVPEEKFTSNNYVELRNSYELVESVVDEPDQYVYGLNIDNTHNYVSDGILTHNCIYAFRGADSSIIKMLSELDSWTHIYLPRNYRSTKQICRFANKVVRQSGSKLKIELISDRSGPSVTVLPSTSNRYSEPIGVDDFATFCEMNRELEGTTAILCRSNSEVAEVCRMLDGAGLNYLTGKKNTDYKYILKSVKDNEYLADWLSSYLNADKYAEFIRIQSIENISRIDAIVKYFSNTRNISERLRKVTSIRKALKDPSRSRMSMAVDILTICGFNPLDNQIEVDENCSSDELFEAVTSVIEEKIVSDLYVGTIHSSKGLEYDNVFLFNVNDYSFKLNKEDQWNLYYVGVTRAKTNLVIFKGDAY